MKIHIIQPEPHDDLISVLDMISWAKSPRLILDLTGRQRIIHTLVDLKRLDRKARKVGAVLGLVTNNSKVIMLAKEAGVPVFPTLEKADSTPWRKPLSHKQKDHPNRLKIGLKNLKSGVTPQKAKPLPDWLRIIFFLMGVAAILCLAFLFTPRAEVLIFSSRATQELELEIKASASSTIPDLAGNIPLYEQAVTVEVQDQVRTSGMRLVPKTNAICQVEFSNLQNEAVVVPATTIVLGPGEPALRFATIQEVTVAGGVGSTAGAEVKALQPGEVGNVLENQVTAIEGGIGVNLLVTNPQPCSGGTDELSPAGTDSDLAVLRAKVKDQLISAAALTLTANQEKEIVVIDLDDPVIEVLQVDLQPGLDMSTDFLQLREKAVVHVPYYRSEDIRNAINLSMDAILEPGMAGIGDSLEYAMVSEPSGGDGLFRLNVHAIREVKPRIEPAEVALELQGLPLSRAKTFLLGLPGVTDCTLTVFPRWWKQMPYLSFQIEVKTP